MAAKGPPLTAALNFRQKDSARKAIQVHKIMRSLQRHIDGEYEMSPTQIRAAEILLKKALPDLQSVELSGEVGTSDVRELSRASLVALASGEGIAAEDGFSDGSADVHSIQ